MPKIYQADRRRGSMMRDQKAHAMPMAMRMAKRLKRHRMRNSMCIISYIPFVLFFEKTHRGCDTPAG